MDRLARELLTAGKTVYVVDDPSNAELLAVGAQHASADRLVRDLVAPRPEP